MRVLIILFGLQLVAGCAVHKKTVSCGVVPGTGCSNVSDVYAKTSGQYYDYRKDRKNGEPGSENDESTPVIKITPSRRALNYADPGKPILSKPVVMRVLYRSFENDEKDLDSGGYTYLRMRDSQWELPD